MAKRRQQGVPQSTNTFDTGANTDVRDFHLNKKAWTHARNAINNSHIGDLGDLGNEPGNKFCSSAPYTIIGTIHREGSVWSIYSTDDQDGHEIGTFNEETCEYSVIVNDPCLNFRTTNLITGASRRTFDCSYRDYFQDNRNPDRSIDVNNVPWIQDCTDDNGDEEGGCIDCVDTDVLDCDKIRLESHIKPPCAHIEQGAAGGSILNGSYYVHLAYVVNGTRVTDYFLMSNIVSIFEHGDANASLDITIDNLDQNFDEYEVVLVSQVSEKLSVVRLGTYSTNQSNITVDLIDPTSTAIKPSLLPINNPIADKSGGIFNVGKYLLRSDLTGKFDFNYQPLANQITTKWQVVEYPEDYYKDGGTNVGYPRDEQGAFFIRFRYATGDVTRSYHLPGRAAEPYSMPQPIGVLFEDEDYPFVNDNNLENETGLTSKVFEMFNTASGTNVNIPLADGGVVVAEGKMGYYESDIFYPDESPEIWNASSDPMWGSTNPAHDLCGKRIRHHKFPENTLYEGFNCSDITNHYVPDEKKIRIMAVAFDNIQAPLDNDGNVIPGIIGYEIFRASRDGNRSVLYKGMINNMRGYDIPDNVTSRTGLYPNYPFNSLSPDPFTSTTEVTYEPQTGITGPPQNNSAYQGYNPNPIVSRQHFTFHSPDTMFYKPFLGQKEVKMYGVLYGQAESAYVEADNHPKHVFVTDLSFYLGIIVGVGLAITKAVGTRTITYQKPGVVVPVQLSAQIYGSYNSIGASALTGVSNSLDDAAISGATTATNLGVSMIDAAAGTDMTNTTIKSSEADGPTGGQGQNQGYSAPGGTITYGDKSQIPTWLRLAHAIPMFATNIGEGADLTMEIIRTLSKPRQHAIQYQGYCGYESFGCPTVTNRRRIIGEANYLSGHLQNYKLTHRINNALRAKTVVFDTQSEENPVATIQDVPAILRDGTMDSILASSQPLNSKEKPYLPFSRRAASHYVAFKTRLRSQYGDVYNPRQLPVSTCYHPIDTRSSGTLFGGDTYIGRYQEKNTFYHFYEWLEGGADRAEFNYHFYDSVQHTAFWMDTEPFDTMEFMNSIGQAISTVGQGGGNGGSFLQSLVTPSDKHSFDRGSNTEGFFTVKNAYMYLFHSSVRDFFVETILNIDHRDHGGTEATSHWSVLQDLKTMFKMNNIRAGNFYKLDRGLSVSYLPFSKVNWNSMQDRDYDPNVSEKCYTRIERRLGYSLPQETQLKRDNWSVFLANNFKDFDSRITTIKSVRSTGIMILFERSGPGLFPGVDELQMKSGTTITVGDGGLFRREMQTISNADTPHEYGSCQSRRSAINTPVGTFYLSLDQGKIFGYSGKGLMEVSMKNNQHWFNQYLPYQLLKDFPDYDLLDNPVVGIGCQSIYDNEWGLAYFCKTDYRVKPQFLDSMEYLGDGIFLVDKIARVKTGDPMYFDDASWTVSFDPKNKEFISWHDWHPDLVMAGTNGFTTTKDDGIWQHNKRCDLYCNYYGVDYPFEVEFQLDNLPAVTTLRSVEYFMQVFEFSENCRDRFHVLDFNFDEAVVYNSEQVSGLLTLNLSPKNNIAELLSFPTVNSNDIDILYSKEEQKYRFNQFWDVTNDRKEFGVTQGETIWQTEPNGYIKNLNPLNLNYTKAEFQRKKIRHNNNRVLLRRVVSGNKKMLMILNNTKLQNSPG